MSSALFMPDTYDTVICGAGPSGTVAGRTLAKNGHSALIIDKDDFPRDKPCGGGLCPHVDQFEFFFRELPEILESTCRRGVIYSENGKYAADTGVIDVAFYNIRRKRFDHKLLQLAQKAGAGFRQGMVTGITIAKDGVEVSLKSGDTIKARSVIGATGANDRLLKQIARENNFEDVVKKSMATIVVHEFEVDEEFITGRYGEEKSAHIQLKQGGMPGYGWIFSKKDVLNIGFGSYNHYMRKITVKQEFQNFLERFKKRNYVPQDLRVESFHAAPLPLGTGYPVTYTSRGLITGDAAGFVSALSGEGIFYAMDSGQIAGEVLSRQLEKDRLGKDDLALYQQRWYEAWGKDLEVLRWFQKWLMRFPNKAIKLAQKDEELLNLLLQLFMGSISAHREKRRIIKLVTKNLFRF